MKNMWAPWRIEYIQMEKPEGCILCDKPAEDKDAQNYILYRGEKNYTIMNYLPQTSSIMRSKTDFHVAPVLPSE